LTLDSNPIISTEELRLCNWFLEVCLLPAQGLRPLGDMFAQIQGKATNYVAVFAAYGLFTATHPGKAPRQI
jgi:hypothetical protein